MEIPSTGLVAATVHMSLETETIFTTHRRTKFMRQPKRDIMYTTTTKRNLKIPVWVHKRMKPADDSAIPIERLEKSDCEMWISIAEMRRAGSSFKLACSKGHNYEWLACGSIKYARVSRVMPYDGKKLHKAPGPTPVRSNDNAEPWRWEWNREVWYLENQHSLKRNLETSGLEDAFGTARKRPRFGDGSTPTFHRYTWARSI